MLDTNSAARSFAAAGSEPRLRVLRTLVRAGHTGLSVNEIQERVDIPASTLAHHLRHLNESGLIDQFKDGRSVISRANFDHVKALAEFLLYRCCEDSEPNKD